MPPNPIKLLEDILRIYSPTGEEERIASYIVKTLEKCGIKSERDSAGNVIAEIGSGDPIILLCGHMDTVSGEIPVRRDGMQVYGRGAVDAKGPLASMLFTFQEFSKKSNPPRIVLACVVDEEGESKGIKEFLKRDWRPDYAVFGEPSGADDLILGYRGSLRVNLRYSTQTGHSAAPWLFDNAIEEAFNIWKKVKRIDYGEENSRFRSLSSCLIKVEGGSKFSKVPDTCDLLIDFRLPPGLKPQQLFQMVKKEIGEDRRRGKESSVEIKEIGGIEAYETSNDSSLVDAFSIAIRKVRKRQPVYLKKTGTADVNIIAKKYTIPILAYGPGDSRLDHSDDEHINVRDFLDSIEVYKKALTRLQCLHT